MALDTQQRELSRELEENCRLLVEALGDAPDLVRRYLWLGRSRKAQALVLALSGLYDPGFVSEHVVRPISALANEATITRTNAADHVVMALNAATDVEETSSLKAVIHHLLRGLTIVLVDGSDRAIVVGSAAPPERGLMEPESEALVRGPRDGFNELLSTTIALVRQRVRAPSLRIEEMHVGDLAPTAVTLFYIDGRVDEGVLDTVRTRIREIRVDTLFDTGELAEFISDQRYPLFPTVLMTERPDRVAAGLIEGKVAVAVDGSPVVLLAPNSFWDFLMSPEDYYQNPFLVTFLRWVRVVSFLVALMLPALYVSATSFHQEMIPTTLALRIAAGREGTAFPAVIEAILLEAQFELLREAGLRIPRKVGTAVSIVGVLVIGQALVAAGVVSPIMITVVGGTAVASFAVPIFAVSTPARLLRFPLMILAGSFGIYGVALGTFVIFAHAASLQSFGRPYLMPVAPLRLRELLDSPFYRAPRYIHERAERPFAPAGLSAGPEAGSRAGAGATSGHGRRAGAGGSARRRRKPWRGDERPRGDVT